jgi:secreted trypsin-like serine protease
MSKTFLKAHNMRRLARTLRFVFANILMALFAILSLVVATRAWAVLGGTSVTESELLAKSTVQILAFQVNQHRDQQLHPLFSGRCTGTLLTENIIVTAAHCTNQLHADTWIYFSTNRVSDPTRFIYGNTADPKIRRVLARVIYKSPTSGNGQTVARRPFYDIALYKFEGTAPVGYLPAQLLPPNDVLAMESLLVAGFGVTDTKTKAFPGSLQKIILNIANPRFLFGEMSLETTDSHGVCVEDSGGPAYAERAGKLLLAGIVSGPEVAPGPKTPFCSGRTVFTRLQDFAGWIAANLQFLKTSSQQGLILK